MTLPSMKEYLELIGELERKPEMPKYQRRGMLDILSRITSYMNNEELRRYKELSEQFTRESGFKQ